MRRAVAGSASGPSASGDANPVEPAGDGVVSANNDRPDRNISRDSCRSGVVERQTHPAFFGQEGHGLKVKERSTNPFA